MIVRHAMADWAILFLTFYTIINIYRKCLCLIKCQGNGCDTVRMAYRHDGSPFKRAESIWSSARYIHFMPQKL